VVQTRARNSIQHCAHRCARAHGNTNICFSQRGGVVDAVAGHGHHVPLVQMTHNNLTYLLEGPLAASLES